ncbi:aldehyde dehydrogenase family protein [Caulobacter segnis]
MTKPEFIGLVVAPALQGPLRQFHRRPVGRRRPTAATSTTPRRSPAETICEIARCAQDVDVERALDAAHAAKAAWGTTSAAERSRILLTHRRPDGGQPRGPAPLAETWDNGKPIRETLAADIPLAIDHFRYFAGCLARRRRARSPRSTTTPSPTTSTSRWASSARSSRGTSRS